MFTRFCSLLFILVLGLFSSTGWALTINRGGTGTNNYLFIDNDVDREFFITSSNTDPRFTGANIWTRYSSRQTSLGYMGNSGWNNANYYFDLWIENSPISQPFLGIRCMSTGANCPAAGYIVPDAVDKQGLYHTMSGSNVANGSYGAGTLSPSAYQYFRNQTVGAQDTIDLNLCYTRINYDYQSGNRCKDLTRDGTWRQYTMVLNKYGHLNLNSTNAMAEIWVASDGSPSVSLGSELCQTGVVRNISGLICKVVSYKLNQTKAITSLNFTMLIDNAILGFNPANRDVQYSGNSTDWNYYNSSTRFDRLFSNSGDYIYVFFSSDFFKKSLAAGTSLGNGESAFTFSFTNSATSQSGYYQFTPSTRINILPREYGISIVASNGSAAPKASGKIGDSAPIELEYKVTTSAARQADSITAQVIGASKKIGGLWWCVFSSPEGDLDVPIPAYLSWTANNGAVVRQRNSCGEDPVDMTKARWVQTAWNANVNEGYFYATTLKLQFPMDESRSRYTVEGQEWMGAVSASGEIRVTAKWIGVNR